VHIKNCTYRILLDVYSHTDCAAERPRTGADADLPPATLSYSDDHYPELHISLLQLILFMIQYIIKCDSTGSKSNVEKGNGCGICLVGERDGRFSSEYCILLLYYMQRTLLRDCVINVSRYRNIPMFGDYYYTLLQQRRDIKYRYSVRFPFNYII